MTPTWRTVRSTSVSTLPPIPLRYLPPLIHVCAEDDSPYPEVRAAVANTDDPDMPCATFRAWLVGLIWAILIPGLDQFFFFRYPSVTITGVSKHLSRWCE